LVDLIHLPELFSSVQLINIGEIFHKRHDVEVVLVAARAEQVVNDRHHFRALVVFVEVPDLLLE